MPVTGAVEIRFGKPLVHETHVAQCAGICDGLEVRRGQMLDIFMFALVNQVEELGKTVAQIEAASAAMTDVKHPTKFRVERSLVVKRFIGPGDWMAGRCIETAFAQGKPSNDRWKTKRPEPL